MRRPLVKYFCAMAVTASLFFWRTLLTNQFTRIIGSEAVNYNYSWFRFWVASLRQGHIPLWDPYTFCGRPFAGEMLPSAFYPVHLFFLLVPFTRDGLFSPRLYNETFVLHHLLALFFTFALLRELGRSRFAAYLGACCFSLCSMLVNMIWLPFVEAGIWLPAIFLFLIRALKRERAGDAVWEGMLAGVCLGLSILTGGLHFSIMQGIVVVTAIAYYGAAKRAPWPRLLIILAVIVAVGGCASAVQLLPSLEYGKFSLRYIDGGPFPASEKIPYHRLHPGMWPQSIASVLFRTAFRGIIGGGESWPIYVGVLPFFLAVTAVRRCWSNLWVRYLTALAVLAFAYSLTELSPLHGVLYAVIPYLWVVRTASRFIYLSVFALSVLAAFGFDAMQEAPASSWSSAQLVLRWVAIACAAVLTVPAVLGQVTLDTWAAYSLVLIAASCGIYGLLTTRAGDPTFRVLAAAFLLFDLSAFNWGETDTHKRGGTNEPLEQMVSLKPVADFVRSRADLGRVKVDIAPEPNIGDAYGLYQMRGGGGTLLTNYSRLLGKHEDLLNIRYAVKPAALTDPAPVYQDATWKVYEIRNGFPRAWIVHQTAVEGSEEAVFRRMDDTSVDLKKVAVLDRPLQQKLTPATEAGDHVHFVSYEADGIALDADAAGAGLLVLSEIYYPGWRATVNGTAAEIAKVDGALRGVVVPAGHSRITLEYRPASFYAGGVLSLLTIVLVAAGFGARMVRARQAP